MGKSTYPRYKYCIVPQCVSSTIKTPAKIFFFVPRGVEVREKWCLAMKRDEKKYQKLSGISTLHCCEDHFNILEDTENYWQFKIMGESVSLRLKKNVLPHLFECQKVPVVERIRGSSKKKKRKVKQIVKEAVVEKMLMKTEYSDDDKFLESEEEDSLLRISGKVKCQDEQNSCGPSSELNNFEDVSGAPFPMIKQEPEDSTTSALKEEIDIEDHKHGWELLTESRDSFVIFQGGSDRESVRESEARQVQSTESNSGGEQSIVFVELTRDLVLSSIIIADTSAVVHILC